MAQRRHHYELAFEQYLRTRRIPYVAVDEARKALLPEDAPTRLALPGADGTAGTSLKSFDFVIYGAGSNLLVEVKGRRVIRRTRRSRAEVLGVDVPVRPARVSRSRLETWVTLDDVRSLMQWQTLFGGGFEGAFVFVYWCDEQPPDGLFQEVFEHRGRWYALRGVLLDLYQRAMKTRSPRWGTVHVAPAVFERISQPFASDWSETLHRSPAVDPGEAPLFPTL